MKKIDWKYFFAVAFLIQVVIPLAVSFSDNYYKGEAFAKKLLHAELCSTFVAAIFVYLPVILILFKKEGTNKKGGRK